MSLIFPFSSKKEFLATQASWDEYLQTNMPSGASPGDHLALPVNCASATQLQEFLRIHDTASFLEEFSNFDFAVVSHIHKLDVVENIHYFTAKFIELLKSNNDPYEIERFFLRIISIRLPKLTETKKLFHKDQFEAWQNLLLWTLEHYLPELAKYDAKLHTDRRLPVFEKLYQKIKNGGCEIGFPKFKIAAEEESKLTDKLFWQIIKDLNRSKASLEDPTKWPRPLAELGVKALRKFDVFLIKAANQILTNKNFSLARENITDCDRYLFASAALWGVENGEAYIDNVAKSPKQFFSDLLADDSWRERRLDTLTSKIARHRFQFELYGTSAPSALVLKDPHPLPLPITSNFPRICHVNELGSIGNWYHPIIEKKPGSS